MNRHLLVAIALLCLAPALARAADDQRSNAQSQAEIDPAYRLGAQATGGRVYDMRRPEDRKAFQDEITRAHREARWQRWQERVRVPSETKPLLYVILKWSAYTAWCFVGLGLAGVRAGRWTRAAGWGTLRLLLGLAFGAAIFLACLWMRVFPENHALYPLLYVAIYLPVRWIEWSIMARLMAVPATAWRLQGIAVSCSVDALQMLLLGSLIPVGRFLC